MGTRHSLSLAVALAAVFAGSFVVIAQVGGTGGIRVPYAGYLERNGAPVDDDDIDLRFTLLDEGSAPCGSSIVVSTAVSQGSFAVELGPLPPACVVGQEVYVSVEVDPDGAGFVALGGAHRLYPASSAHSSGPGAFGAGQELRFTIAPGDQGDAGTIGYRLFSNHLDIVGAGTTASNRTVRVWDNLIVGQTATANAVTSTSVSATSVSANTITATSSATVGNLDVGYLLADYDSQWFSVSNADGEIALAHGLGGAPRHIVLEQCGSIAGSFPNYYCTHRVVATGTRGYQDGNAYINPVMVTSDGSNIFIGVFSGWWAWGYWTPALGHTCSPDPNCYDGYYRVYAWR